MRTQDPPGLWRDWVFKLIGMKVMRYGIDIAKIKYDAMPLQDMNRSYKCKRWHDDFARES